MKSPSLLEQARDGDGAAIAALLSSSLKAKGIAVRAERESYCLSLWFTGNTVPPQGPTVAYARRAIERLQPPTIGILNLYGEQIGFAQPAWHEEIALLSLSSADAEASHLPPEPSNASLPKNASPNPDSLSALEHGPTPVAVARAYEELGLALGEPLAHVEAVYFKRRAELLRQGDRAALEPLKWAFATIKTHLEQSAVARSVPPTPLPTVKHEIPESGMEKIQRLLMQQGISAEVFYLNDQLHICWYANGVANPTEAVHKAYELLKAHNLAILGLEDSEEIVFSALGSDRSVVWQQVKQQPRLSVSLLGNLGPRYTPPPAIDDTDILSFQNRYSNGLIFPVLMVLGMLMNAMPIVNALLYGIKIWLHEFGHATVAWLAGRQALPLPIGWTTISTQRSLFVYLGLLTLLGLLLWAGRREGKRWPVVLAVTLMVMQFAMTWLLPADSFDMLFSFGGIGGEIYLSALLIVGFFFPLPEYFRWDFYRFPVVLGAAFCFWGQVWLWQQVPRGKASIPFGSMWGDADHGDMNQLVNYHGWTPGDIIGTYSAIAHLCLFAIVAVYGYTLFRQHRELFVALGRQWLP